MFNNSKLKLCLDAIFHQKKLAIVLQSMIYVQDFFFRLAHLLWA